VISLQVFLKKWRYGYPKRKRKKESMLRSLTKKKKKKKKRKIKMRDTSYERSNHTFIHPHTCTS
jgi:hypothetical protein